MILIIIILGLLTERFLGALKDLRHWEWFHSYAGAILRLGLGKTTWLSYVGVMFILAGVSLPVAYLFYELAESSLFLWLLLGFAVLISSFGPKTFYEDIKSYCAAMDTGYVAIAEWYAEDLLDRPLQEEEKLHLVRTVLEAMFVAANDRLFAVIFWLVVAGPAGALFYRLSSQLRSWAMRHHPETTFTNTVCRVHFWIDWMPTRALAFSYSITGNFVGGVHYCRHLDKNVSDRWEARNHQMLICAGVGALGMTPDNIAEQRGQLISDALGMIRRTVLLWLGVVALFTIIGVLK